MTTVTLWLLIVVGYRNDNPHVLERFATQADCEVVRTTLRAKYRSDAPPTSTCVEARVARP